MSKLSDSQISNKIDEAVAGAKNLLQVLDRLDAASLKSGTINGGPTTLTTDMLIPQCESLLSVLKTLNDQR